MLSLLDHGCTVTIIDNLDNAFQVAFERMKKLAGSKAGNMKFIKVRYRLLSRRMHSSALTKLELAGRSAAL